MQLQHKPKLGIGLALTGGLIISLDIPVILLAGSDPWLFMMSRGYGMAIVLGAIYLFARHLTETPERPLKDRDFVEVGLIYGLTSFLFTVSVYLTDPANLVFILAFNPLIAALLAWVLIGERPSLVTWLAMLATTAGVAIIVSHGLSTNTGVGDLTALATATVLAWGIVKTRKSGKDLSLSAGLGGAVTGTIAMPIAFLYSSLPEAPLWLLINGFVMAPIAAFALSLAPRYIPAPQVALFFLLETMLAPIWVWLIFSEIPDMNVLIGGAVILTAIAVHSAIQLRGSVTNKQRKIGR